MYLDKIIGAHGLLQAIAPVNRVGGDSKNEGFVVDYVGVGHHLKKAFDNYDEREQMEVVDVLSFPEEEIRELKASRDAVLALLKKHGLTDLNEADVFYDEDLQFEFMGLFKKFTKNLNLVFPARQALDSMGDFQPLVAINEMAAKHFRDGRLSRKGIPPKLRTITDAFLESKGINVKVGPLFILNEDFEKEVEKHSRPKTKAAEIKCAIRHHLDVDLNDDPELQETASGGVEFSRPLVRGRTASAWKIVCAEGGGGEAGGLPEGVSEA